MRELATQRQPLQLGHAARSGCRGELIALFALLAYTTVGAVWFKLAPGASMADISWVASFYFAVTTVTTVGYGDLCPESPEGKIFTVFYALLGLVFVFAALSPLLDALMWVKDLILDPCTPPDRSAEITDIDALRKEGHWGFKYTSALAGPILVFILGLFIGFFIMDLSLIHI